MAALAGGGIASEDGSAEPGSTWEGDVELFPSVGLQAVLKEDVRQRPFMR